MHGHVHLIIDKKREGSIVLCFVCKCRLSTVCMGMERLHSTSELTASL